MIQSGRFISIDGRTMNFIPTNDNFAGVRMNVIERERATREDVPPETRLCVDCRHFQPERSFWLFRRHRITYAKCALIFDKEIDVVSGEKMLRPTYCSIARKFAHLCGPEGRFWEKRR